MSENFSIENSAAGGHPHDLLARLYREIGISAVAAALEVAREPVEIEPYQTPWAPLGEDLAA
jgi:hypothetical protein